MEIPKIEKGVPIPPKQRYKRPPYSKYGFHKLEVGDSMAFPIEKHRNIQSAAHMFSACHGFDVVTRLLQDELRIWRIK